MGTKLGTTGTSTPHDSDMAYPPGMELHGSKWRIKKRVPQDLLRKHPDLYPSQFLTLKTDESDRRAAASRAWVWLGTLEEEFTRVRETGSKFKRVLPQGAADEIIHAAIRSALSADEESRQSGLDDFMFERLDSSIAARREREKRVIARGQIDAEAEDMAHEWLLASGYLAAFRPFLSASIRTFRDQGFPAALTVEGIKYTGDRKERDHAQRPFKQSELERLFCGAEYRQFAADPTQHHCY